MQGYRTLIVAAVMFIAPALARWGFDIDPAAIADAPPRKDTDMPAAITLALSIITSLLPLVKAGTQAYADIKAARDAISAAQVEGRDLTSDEFTAFMAKADAAG